MSTLARTEIPEHLTGIDDAEAYEEARLRLNQELAPKTYLEERTVKHILDIELDIDRSRKLIAAEVSRRHENLIAKSAPELHAAALKGEPAPSQRHLLASAYLAAHDAILDLQNQIRWLERRRRALIEEYDGLKARRRLASAEDAETIGE